MELIHFICPTTINNNHFSDSHLTEWRINVATLNASCPVQASQIRSVRSIEPSNLLTHFSLLPFMCCVGFSEKCYETIHLRYYDIGESWGRIHLRNVEQCTCVAGEIKCERVHYTSKTRFLADRALTMPCFCSAVCFCWNDESETE